MEVQIQHKDKIITIIHMFLPLAKIYLFESYVGGDYTFRDDIAIAIDAKEKIPVHVRGQIMNMITALNISRYINLVDFRWASEDLQKAILVEGEEWKN